MADESWLMVFDNAVVYQDIKEYVIRGSGSIIITTQTADFEQVFKKQLEIKAMNDEDGAGLLLSHLRASAAYMKACPVDRETAKQVSMLVGGLPLAVAHIAGYLRGSKESMVTFIEMFKSREISKIWRKGNMPTTHDYDKSLGTVFKIALKALSTDARHLMDIFAFLSPDNIPLDMVCQIPQGLFGSLMPMSKFK